MVLENILSPQTAREHPWYMGVISFLFAIVGLWLAYYLFPHSASILTLAFIVIAAEPIIRSTFQQEEEEEAEKPGNPTTFLERHFDLIKIYSWFFIGLVIAFAAWYIILPSAVGNNACSLGDFCKQLPARENVFMEQENQLHGIGELRSQLSQEQVNGTGNVVLQNSGGDLGASSTPPTKDRDFLSVALFLFSNNATVLLLAILFSFLFGEGALFLISWNASIIGTVIGKIAAQTLATLPNEPISLLYALGSGIYQGIGFIPHGIPEIIAYYIGAIAGGIISVSMAKQTYKTNEFETIAKDAGAMVITAVIVLFVAALIESYLWLYT